jgi:hypothetical protein
LRRIICVAGLPAGSPRISLNIGLDHRQQTIDRRRVAMPRGFKERNEVETGRHALPLRFEPPPDGGASRTPAYYACRRKKNACGDRHICGEPKPAWKRDGGVKRDAKPDDHAGALFPRIQILPAKHVPKTSEHDARRSRGAQSEKGFGGGQDIFFAHPPASLARIS